MAKFDISNGFYRLFLDPDNAPKLAVLMPRYEGEPQLVAIPLSLTMGWVSSLPTFCAASKTAADIANASLFHCTVLLHHLERTASTHDCWGLPRNFNARPQPPFSLLTSDIALTLALPSPQPGDRTPPSALTALELVELARPLLQPEDQPPLTRHRGPIGHVDVFVDNFIDIVQGSQRRCTNMRCCIMHAVDKVFSQWDLNTMHRKEAISKKKLLKGEGGWSQRKEILGWILDTSQGTFELIDHWKERILVIFKDLHHKRRLGIKKWQQLLGELRFMGPAIPGASGLFGALQLGLSHADKHRIWITPHLRAHLTDFEALAQNIAYHPTCCMEIVPDYPSVISSVDGTKPGMGGGVLFTPGKLLALWHARFPKEIQCHIISTANTTGDLTNSDLEQASVLAQADMASCLFDLWELMFTTLNDNVAAISWNRKGAITSDQAAAYLCHLSSLHHCHYRYHHEVSHIAGKANTMADILSHHHDLLDMQLLTLFNAHFPQIAPWRMYWLPTEMLLALISSLQRRQPTTASWL